MAAKVIVRGGAGNAVQIQGRDAADIAPTNGQALAWDAGDSAWEPQTISSGGSAEWTDTGSVLHPSEETVDNVVVGGTTTGNSDIILGVDGSAKFNEQGASVDFNVQSANQAKMLHVDGTNDAVGVGCDPVEAASNNPSSLLYVSNRSTPTTPTGYAPLVVDNNAAASYINVISDDDGWQGVVLGDATDPDEAGIRYNSANKRMYFTGNGDATTAAVAVIDHNTHRVGINLGTAAPDALLHIDAGSADDVEAFAVSEGTSTRFTMIADFNPGSNLLHFGGYQTRTMMTFDTDGGDNTPAGGLVGFGLDPSTAGEKIAVDGTVAFKVQSAAPSGTTDYGKIVALSNADPATNADIKLLCHFDSAIDDDSSQLDNTISGSGGAAINTTTKKFGAGSLELTSSSSQYVTTTTNPTTWYSAGNFTWDLWINFKSVSVRQGIISSGTVDDIEIELNGSNQFFAHFRDSGGTGYGITGTSNSWTTGQWYHLAVVRQNSTLSLCVDGVVEAQDTSYFTGAIQKRTNDLHIGRYHTGHYLNAYVDEARFTSAARWDVEGLSVGDTAFTPPTSATDGTTELYAADSASNVTKISPHNTDGEWEYFSRNVKTGRTVRVNMMDAIRTLEELSGKKLIEES